MDCQVAHINRCPWRLSRPCSNQQLALSFVVRVCVRTRYLRRLHELPHNGRIQPSNDIQLSLCDQAAEWWGRAATLLCSRTAAALLCSCLIAARSRMCGGIDAAAANCLCAGPAAALKRHSLAVS